LKYIASASRSVDECVLKFAFLVVRQVDDTEVSNFIGTLPVAQSVVWNVSGFVDDIQVEELDLGVFRRDDLFSPNSSVVNALTADIVVRQEPDVGSIFDRTGTTAAEV